MQNKRPIHLPPEPVLRAYMDLLYQSFLFVRGRTNSKNVNPAELHALADALHNLPSMLLDYGGWTDDERYRDLYLRPFDARWGAGAFSLEMFVQDKIREYGADDQPTA
jgi:hypothetical protein